LFSFFFYPPIILLIFFKSFADLLSNSEISEISCSGDLSGSSSGVFGFFADKSYVSKSIFDKDTFHEFSDSAFVFCRFIKSAKSFSDNGFVFQRFLSRFS
jgi:hypothetical protein